MSTIDSLNPFFQSFNGGEISPLAEARVEHPRYQMGCRRLRNAFPLVAGAVTKRPGTVYLGQAKYSDSDTALREFVFSDAQSRILEFGHLYARVWIDTGQILNAAGTAPYEIALPYTAEEVSELSIAQSADIVYIAHPNHPPAKLSRYADNNWTYALVDFTPSINPPSNFSLEAQGSDPAAGTITYSYQITAISADTGEESKPTAIKRITTDALTDTYFVEIKLSTSQQVAGALEYRIYKSRGGSFGFIGRINAPSSASAITFEDRNIGADISDGPPVFKEPFIGAGNYPRFVFFWQQRLAWAATTNRPFTIWFSKSSNYENLSSSSPPKDDDSIEATLATGGQNTFKWFAAGQDLILGTADAEYLIRGTTDTSVLTPTSFQFQKQSAYGSADVEPLLVQGQVLFLQRGTTEAREFTYNYTKDRYDAPSTLILADHLISDRRIVEWTWQSSDNLIWCVMSDGRLIGCTYAAEHEVLAWHQHDTDGFVRDIACIPGQTYDVIFILVDRYVNGQWRSYVERLAPTFRSGDINQAFFVDCGLTSSGDTPAATLVGLTHLEGKVVSIFADGATQNPRKVVNGSLQLDSPAYTVQIGLPYTLQVIPNRPQISLQDGSTAMRKMNVKKAIAHLYQSMNLRVGAEDALELEDILQHDVDNPIEPAFATTRRKFDIRGGWREDKSIIFESDTPTPVTITSVTYDLAVAGGL